MEEKKKINEPSLPEKKDFRIHLNMKSTTYADYAQAKRVLKRF